MKKVALTVILFAGFGVYGFATNKIEVQVDKVQQEPKGNDKSKVDKYDFSLFKFLRTQIIKSPETDSTKSKEQSKILENSKDDTTYHYEKPRDFFKFS